MRIRPSWRFGRALGFAALWLCVFSFVVSRAFSQSWFPDTGLAAIRQHSLELRNGQRILNIAIEPGYEDLPTLAYFRLARGARIMTAYVSNGEAGESDVTAEYPAMLASTRRGEAQEAMTLLGGEAHFICFPDIPAARDSSKIRSLWNHDSLTYRLMELVSRFKPNIILVSRDWEWGEKSLRTRILINDLGKAVRELSEPDSLGRRRKFISLPHWIVDRVFCDQPGVNGLTVPTDQRHSLLQKSYAEMGEEAAQCYRSLHRQRGRWMKVPMPPFGSVRPAYSRVYPGATYTLKTIDAGLPAPAPVRLRSLEREIQTITAAVLAGKTVYASDSGKSREVLRSVAALIQSVNAFIIRRAEFTIKEQHILLAWKSGLEMLRNSLLGVTAGYFFATTTVTDRQVTTLRIDTVTGTSPTGKTDIYFPAVDEGWVVNEDFPRRLALKLHEEYRLLSPAHLKYNIPAVEYGLNRPTCGNPFTFFVLHRDSMGGGSFNYSVTVQLDYAPRLTAEALTPLVRAMDNERVVVRLTNHTWDAVAGAVIVSDSVASSTPGLFHLKPNGATNVDTLTLRWIRELPGGDYLIPLTVNKITVGTFAARKFDVRADTARRVGFITGVHNSPLPDALRRIGIQASAMDSESFHSAADTLDVVVVDRRTCSLRDDLTALSSELNTFVDRGGHLIIMAQDADAWNDTLLFPGLGRRRTNVFDEDSPLWMDSTHRLLSYPNTLRDDDFNGWIFQRAYNSIAIAGSDRVAVTIKDRNTGSPLVLIRRSGKGTVIYVDLALQPQLMNIHPGAFRLLANLISY